MQGACRRGDRMTKLSGIRPAELASVRRANREPAPWCSSPYCDPSWTFPREPKTFQESHDRHHSDGKNFGRLRERIGLVAGARGRRMRSNIAGARALRSAAVSAPGAKTSRAKGVRIAVRFTRGPCRGHVPGSRKSRDHVPFQHCRERQADRPSGRRPGLAHRYVV